MGLGEGINKPEMLQTLEHGKPAGPLKDTGNLGKGTGLREKGDSIWGCPDSLKEGCLASPAPNTLPGGKNPQGGC